jgi:hypothetical protein
MIKDIEEGLRIQVLDADTRRMRENEIKGEQKELARIGADVKQLAAEETSLMQDIASEQSRRADFNQRIEELERALARR